MSGSEMATADPRAQPVCVAALLTGPDLADRWRRRQAKAGAPGPVMHAGGDETFRPLKDAGSGADQAGQQPPLGL
jgi:hypothetical protein